MSENLFEAQYDVTKKSKLKRFYELNKILIYSSVFILIILFSTFSFYFDSKEKEKVLLSENYLQAKVYLEQGNKNEAINILKDVIFANDPMYSTLCLFLILDENLITDYEDLSVLFDHILANNKFEQEVKNLIIFKRALFLSNFGKCQCRRKIKRKLLKKSTEEDSWVWTI